jgi:hypothetical protein
MGSHHVYRLSQDKRPSALFLCLQERARAAPRRAARSTSWPAVRTGARKRYCGRTVHGQAACRLTCYRDGAPILHLGAKAPNFQPRFGGAFLYPAASGGSFMRSRRSWLAMAGRCPRIVSAHPCPYSCQERRPNWRPVSIPPSPSDMPEGRTSPPCLLPPGPQRGRRRISEVETSFCDHSGRRGSLCAAFALAPCTRSKLDPVRFPRAGSFDSIASSTPALPRAPRSMPTKPAHGRRVHQLGGGIF